MAYDVIKQINGREYRYRVQSEPNPLTGKSRNRWTYVGRVTSEWPTATPAPRRSDTRLRLLEALERLIERGDPKAITAGAIATEAGIAHGTFYRYFKDRIEALEAVAHHMRSARGVAEENLRDDFASADEARATLREWIEKKMRTALERPVPLRVWYALIASDERLAAFRVERRGAAIRRLTEHFQELTRRDFARVRDPNGTAVAVFTMIDGIVRSATVERETLEPGTIETVTAIVEQIVFGSATRERREGDVGADCS